MNKLFSLCAALVFSLSALAQSSNLPDTEIKDLMTNKKLGFNETIDTSKITLVNVWATWCIPCIKEIKSTRARLDQWRAEVPFNYMTISIDESRTEAKARSYARSQGWDFPTYIDPNGDLKRSLNFQNPPFTMIIGPGGKIFWTHTGYEEGSENQVFEKLKELAKK